MAKRNFAPKPSGATKKGEKSSEKKRVEDTDKEDEDLIEDQDEEENAEDKEEDEKSAEDQDKEEDAEEEDLDDDEKAEDEEEDDKKASAKERGRIKAILTSEEAGGRQEMAEHLAYNSSMSVKSAIKLLATAPKGQSGDSFEVKMSKVQDPQIGPGGEVSGGNPILVAAYKTDKRRVIKV